MVGLKCDNYWIRSLNVSGYFFVVWAKVVNCVVNVVIFTWNVVILEANVVKTDANVVKVPCKVHRENKKAFGRGQMLHQ